MVTGGGRVDAENEIIRLNGEVAALQADMRNLTGWQHTQNGTIDRVAARVDKLQYWIMGLLGTSVMSLFLLVANLVAKN